jgi:hypothetical protein
MKEIRMKKKRSHDELHEEYALLSDSDKEFVDGIALIRIKSLFKARMQYVDENKDLFHEDAYFELNHMLRQIEHLLKHYTEAR